MKMHNIKVCKNCKKETDAIRGKLIAGDMSKAPGIIPAVPMKCDRCGSSFSPNVEIFLISQKLEE